MFHKSILSSRVVLVFLSIYCLVFTMAISANTQSVVTTHLTVLYENDLHGHLLPFNDVQFGKDVGGVARRAYLMNKFKKENPNTLIFDVGDMLTGTLISSLFQGAADFNIFEKMPYDAMAIGNHDFDYSLVTLRHFIQTGPKPILSANIFQQDNVLLTKPYIIKKLAGLNIAIIGLTTPSTSMTNSKNVVGLHFGDPTTELGKFMPEFKKQADLVIVLSHLGYSVDKDMAQKVKGIDIILGGHSHTKIDSYEKSGNTIIVQDYMGGIFLGKLDLTIIDKKIVDQKAVLIPVNSNVPDDKAIAAYLKPYADKALKKMNIIVGKTDKDLNESEVGTWLCDVYRKKLNVDMALQDMAGTRTAIYKGNVTYNDIYTLLPFDNAMVVLEAKGDLIQQILNKCDKSSVSGATFNLISGKAENIQMDGKPLDLSKTYTIGANDYLANGGAGLSVMKQAKWVRTDKQQRDMVYDYLKEHPVMSAASK